MKIEKLKIPLFDFQMMGNCPSRLPTTIWHTIVDVLPNWTIHPQQKIYNDGCRYIFDGGWYMEYRPMRNNTYIVIFCREEIIQDLFNRVPSTKKLRQRFSSLVFTFGFMYRDGFVYNSIDSSNKLHT